MTIVPEQGAAEPTCMDCREPYSSARFPDLVIADEAWQSIAPDDGLLCPCCINARLERVGLTGVHARFRSGPMARGDEPSEDEVERAARAMIAEMGRRLDDDDPAEWSDLDDDEKRQAMDIAAAALTAARSQP